MKKAFTLIELLIVIAIIAILATVVFLNLNSARNRARDAQIKSDMSEMAKALEVIKVDRDLTASGWTNLNTTAAGDSNINNWKDIDGKALIAALPSNPISGQNYQIRILAGNDYAFLSRLTKNTTTFWCVYNGAGRELTGTQAATRDSCDG